jgi:hypothetical protein
MTRSDIVQGSGKRLPDLVSICSDNRQPVGGIYAIDSNGHVWHGRWILKGGNDNEFDWVKLPRPTEPASQAAGELSAAPSTAGPGT